jgi:hypothetical protein
MKLFEKQNERAREALRRRRAIVSPVRVGESRQLPDLASAAKADPKAFMEKVERLIGEGKLRLAKINLKDMQRAFSDVTIPTIALDREGRERAVTASAFPLLVGNLMVAEINDTLEEVDAIGEQLVTDLEDPKKVTIIDRLVTLDTKKDRVEEFEDFPEISASEESFEVLAKRNGRRISISQDMIEQSDTPNIIERINKIVEIASTFVERQTLDAVTDRYGSAAAPGEPYVYRKRGATLTGLYTTNTATHSRAPSGTSVSGNPLSTIANLSAVRAVLANMRDDRGERGVVPISRTILLVPDALLEAAWKLLNSELTAGLVNEKSPWGPSGPFQPRLLSSPKLDDASATDYFMGDFPAQFRRKWQFRFEYVTLGADQQQAFLDRRVAFQARVAWSCGVNAIDHNRVVRSQP